MEPLQDKIEKAKRELEQMIDLNPQVMLLVDRDGRITRANKALLELLGLHDYPSVLGKQLEEVFPARGTVNSLLLRQDGDREHEAEVRLHGDGTRSLNFTVIGAGTGGELSVVIVRDVGAEKAQAAFLEMRHKKEAVKAVAGALMHNVNQSLTVIMVNAQLMNVMIEKGSINTEDLANSLRDIVRETTCIAELLKNIGRTKVFMTEPYPGSDDIMDIKSSSGCPGSHEAGMPRAFLWLESSYEAAVDVLLKALEAHEPGAFRHAKRTAEVAAILARRMGYTADAALTVHSCATLHDIGRLGIPDEVLRKAEPLTDREMALMRTHPDIGFNLLRNFPVTPDQAEVARSHHERWDGAGYPRGLAGTEIHGVARIVAVAEAFDSLSHQSCATGMSDDEIAAEIIAGSGSRFDPDVVAAFRDSLPLLKRVVAPGAQA